MILGRNLYLAGALPPMFVGDLCRDITFRGSINGQVELSPYSYTTKFPNGRSLPCIPLLRWCSFLIRFAASAAGWSTASSKEA